MAFVVLQLFQLQYLQESYTFLKSITKSIPHILVRRHYHNFPSTSNRRSLHPENRKKKTITKQKIKTEPGHSHYHSNDNNEIDRPASLRASHLSITHQRDKVSSRCTHQGTVARPAIRRALLARFHGPDRANCAPPDCGNESSGNIKDCTHELFLRTTREMCLTFQLLYMRRCITSEFCFDCCILGCGRLAWIYCAFVRARPG